MSFLLRASRLTYNTRLRLMLMPYLLGLLMLVILPAVLSLGFAFFHFEKLSPSAWVGNLNFILAYTDELFILSVINSLALVILPVPLRVMGAFLLAWFLKNNTRFIAWIRAAVYLPNVIPAAAYALTWLWILNPLFGPLNMGLRVLGLETPTWFLDRLWARPAIILMSLWQIGEGFLVCLAAFQDLPPDVNDAARVDGAGLIQGFVRITLPLMAPILLILSFRDAILTFQESFTTIYLTTGGGPYYATYTLPFFVYEQGFDLLSIGTASAALWAMYGLTWVIVVSLYFIARQWNIGLTEETFVI